MANKIILSTDIGSDIDDALALYIAMRHPDINLLGVYTTNGDMELRAKIAKTMVDLSGYPTVVATGEANALHGHPTAYSTGSEKDAIRSEYKDKSLSKLGIVEDGVGDLVSMLKSDNPIIASIAPLTNVARAIDVEPSLDSTKTKVYIMGGRINNPEHNFRHDVEAARQVLNSNLDLVVLSGDLCGKYRRPLVEFETLESPSGQYIQEMLGHWNTYNTWRGFMMSGASVDYPRMLGQGARFPKYFTNLIDTLNNPSFVRDHPEEYALVFSSFMGVLGKNKGSPFFEEIARKVEEQMPKEVAVHDTYIIYAIAHPEKLVTQRANLAVGPNGEMSIGTGDKHTLVTNLDFEHFKGFLGEYLK
jgi:purine nucleosidase